jgi:tetratricopeptide (TPR) repeat protein
LNLYQIAALIPVLASLIGLLVAFASGLSNPTVLRKPSADRFLIFCFTIVSGYSVWAFAATYNNLKRAEVARIRQDGRLVIKETSAALRIDPDSAEAYAKRAVGYSMVGDCSRALIDVEKAMAISTGVPGAYVVRGVCASRSGNNASAIADFTRAIDLDSTYAAYAAYADRAQQLWIVGDDAGAKKDMDQALKLVPDNPSLLATLLFVRAGMTSQNNKELALADLHRLLAMQIPDILRGQALMVQAGILEEIPGRESAALQSADEAVKLAPDISAVYVERGNAFHTLRLYPNALDDYAKAIAIDPSSVIAYIDRSGVYLDTGNLISALDDLNKAIQLSPTLIEAYSRRAEVFTRLGETEKAAADLAAINRLLSAHPLRSLSAGSQRTFIPIS